MEDKKLEFEIKFVNKSIDINIVNFELLPYSFTIYLMGNVGEYK